MAHRVSTESTRTVTAASLHLVGADTPAPTPATAPLPYLPLELVLHLISLLDPTRRQQRHLLAAFAAASRACSAVAERVLYSALELDGRDFTTLAADPALLPARRRKLAAARFVRIVAPLTPAELDAAYALARDDDRAPLFPSATAVHLVDTRRVLAPRMARPGAAPPSDVLLFAQPAICVDGSASSTLLKFLPCAAAPAITSHATLASSAFRDLVPQWSRYTVFDDSGNPATRSLRFMSQIASATRAEQPRIELRYRAQPDTARVLRAKWEVDKLAFDVRFSAADEVPADKGCDVCGQTWAAERPEWQATPDDRRAWREPPRNVGRAAFEERSAEWSHWGLAPRARGAA
ncbi:hypothetical protein Q8F55_001527 [Vanrija albida]|uniref:F-box domain-containing protein n=1 Tax=Vanrija albida TaxID=181172 RepID=A0ABR3QGA5_9TREE